MALITNSKPATVARAMKCRAFFFAMLFLFAALAWVRQSAATVVDMALVRCPNCGKKFAVQEILAYDSFTMPGGPPQQVSVCPYCCYACLDEPGKRLSGAEAKRVRDFLATLPAHISPPVEKWLKTALQTGFEDTNTDDVRAFEIYLAGLCDAARQGKSISTVPVPLFHRPTDSDRRYPDRERKLKALLPVMVRALRAGHSGPLPPDTGDRQMSALFSTAELIKKGKEQAAEYFILWALQADEAALKEENYAVAQNLEALAETPNLPWPSVQLSKARVPLITDCLRYAHRECDLTYSMRNRIASRNWDQLSGITLAASSGRRDRGAVACVSKALAAKVIAPFPDPICHYFEHCGEPTDLPMLEKYAQRVSPGDRDDYEQVILEIRLREWFGVQPS
jgi:hypothetical protein